MPELRGPMRDGLGDARTHALVLLVRPPVDRELGRVRQAQRAAAAYEAMLELEAATARWPEHLREANARMLERVSMVPATVEQLGLFGEASP